jgi:hypothetical protein
MANSQGLHLLLGRNAAIPTELDAFVELIPALYYAINDVFEESTAPDFSKKVGVVLWILHGSQTTDNQGKYLTTSELVERFRDWFVVGEKNAGPEVSKAKSALLDGDYIMIAGGRDHIHLTSKGEKAVLDIRAKAKEALRGSLARLSSDDREQLLEIASRMVALKKMPPAPENQQSFDFGSEEPFAS